jgi:hypothetical protein
MSDVSQGPGWWQASDHKWYPPEAVPGTAPPPPPPHGAGAARSGSAPYPGPSTPYPAPSGPYYTPTGVYPAPSGPYQTVVVGRTSGLAIASFVLSVLWLWGIGSLLAVIFAVISLRHIRDAQGREGGKGLAIAGLVIGIVGVIGSVLVTLSLFAVSNVARSIIGGQVIAQCQSDAAMFETAVVTYKAQVGSYPPAGNGAVMTTRVTIPGGSTAGPFLTQLAPTTNYTIWTDGQGGVYVYPPSQTSIPTSFSQANNADVGSPCTTLALNPAPIR